MENQLKGPTQPRKISDSDAQCISKFKTLLLDCEAPYLRKVLLSIYFELTQLMTKKEGDVYPGASGDLYYLQCFIELFDKEE